MNETFLCQSVDCPNKCIVHLFNQICLASNERCHIFITNLNFEVIIAMDLSQGLQCLLSTVGLPASSLLKAVTAVKDTALKQSRWTVCNLLHKLETFYFTIHCCEMWHESKDYSFLFDCTDPFPTMQRNKLSSAIIRTLPLASAYSIDGFFFIQLCFFVKTSDILGGAPFSLTVPPTQPAVCDVALSFCVISVVCRQWP